MFNSSKKKAARRDQIAAEETVYFPVVPDTDKAVSEKLYRLADQCADPELAASWRRTAKGIAEGKVHPSVRRDFANGTRFPKTSGSNGRIRYGRWT
jgi:hypothetical protein